MSSLPGKRAPPMASAQKSNRALRDFLHRMLLLVCLVALCALAGRIPLRVLHASSAVVVLPQECPRRGNTRRGRDIHRKRPLVVAGPIRALYACVRSFWNTGLSRQISSKGCLRTSPASSVMYAHARNAFAPDYASRSGPPGQPRV